MDEPSFTWPLSASDETFFDLEITFARAPNAQERVALAQALAQVEHRGGISVRPVGLGVGWHGETMRLQLVDERRASEPAEAATRGLIHTMHAAVEIAAVRDVVTATLAFEADATFDAARRKARRSLREAPPAREPDGPAFGLEECEDGLPPRATPLVTGEVDTPRGRCRCLGDRLEWHRDGEVFSVRFPKPNLRNLFGLEDGKAVIVFLGGADFTVLGCRPDAVVMVGACPSGALVPDYSSPLHRDGTRLMVMRDEDDYPDQAAELVGLETALEETLANGAALEDNAFIDLDGAFPIDFPL